MWKQVVFALASRMSTSFAHEDFSVVVARLHVVGVGRVRAVISVVGYQYGFCEPAGRALSAWVEECSIVVTVHAYGVCYVSFFGRSYCSGPFSAHENASVHSAEFSSAIEKAVYQ